jgi:hypothetical protein
MGGRVRAESPISESGGTRMVVELRPWTGIVTVPLHVSVQPGAGPTSPQRPPTYPSL